MRTARLTARVTTLLLAATAAVAALGMSAADGAKTGRIHAAVGDTPWPHPSAKPVAATSFGDTPWPVGGLH